MSSPNVNTSSIPNTYVPGVYGQENVQNAIRGLTPLNDTLLLLAQMTPSGTATANVPTKVFSDADAALYFGQGSIAHLAAKAAFEANPNINLSIVGIADAIGSNPATGYIFPQSGSTGSGNMTINIGDVTVNFGIASGAYNGDIATSITNALAQVSNLLPFTVYQSSSEVEFTARNGGTLGNTIPISFTCTAPGVTFTSGQMTGGTTDPDLGDYSTSGTVLNSVVAGGYTIYISTLNDATNLGKLKSMLEFVSSATEQRGAIGVFGYTDKNGSLANVETLAGTTLNEGRLTVGYVSSPTDNIAKTEPFKVAAAYAAMLASQSDPAVPYDGLVVSSIATPSVADRFTFTQKDSLLHNGVTPIAVVPGEQMSIVRAVSTYTTNSSAISDPTLLDINTIRTLDYVRVQVRTRLTNVFQRSKLNARTISLIKAEVLDVLYILEQAQIVQNVSQYESGVIVEQDLSDVTRVDIAIPTNIVSGLHVIAASFNLILGL